MAMEMKEIKKFTEDSYKVWGEKFKGKGKEIEAFVITLKLEKKIGELAHEVAKSFGFSKKPEMTEPLMLERRLGAVVMTTFLLGRVLDVDMEKAIKLRMEMILERAKAGRK